MTDETRALIEAEKNALPVPISVGQGGTTKLTSDDISFSSIKRSKHGLER